MTTRGPSRKQIIILMSSINSERFMAMLNKYIANINKSLKDIKLDIMADFIQADNRGLVITTNKVVAILDLNIIKSYIKNIGVIDSHKVISPRLPQSKLYLKILGIPYFIKDTNLPIMFKTMEKVFQTTHIFSDIILASHLWVIKAFPKFNMTVIWVNIWDAQSGFKAKSLINRCFNIGRHITTIWGTNINSNILQCKNC